jgi:hypothetical protein
MNIETLLYEYPSLGKWIYEANTELSDAIKCKDELLNTLKANEVTGMPKGGDGTYDAITATIARYEKHIFYLTNKVNSLIEQKEYTDRLIASLEPQERRIIELRYFKHNNWYVVSMKAHYSEKMCRIVQRKAIEKMSKVA